MMPVSTCLKILFPIRVFALNLYFCLFLILSIRLKIEIFSSTVAGFNYDDCPGFPVWREPCEWLGDRNGKYPLHLISNQPNYLKLNVGTGKGTSVVELIKIFERVNKVRVPYVYAKRRPGDKCSLVADNSLLISKLKIAPKSSIEDMCRDGWKWKKLNPNGY